jgi:probable rRNA maturation factor
MPVEILSQQRLLRVPRRRIQSTVESMLRSARCTRAEVNVLVVDDATIHTYNREYLGHDYPTDVVTFPSFEGTRPTSGPLGDLVVSAETALREASVRGHGPQAELLLYVVHGVLHLLGYDDHSAEERDAMRAQERKILGVDLFTDGTD